MISECQENTLAVWFDNMWHFPKKSWPMLGQAQSFSTCLRKPGGKYLVISNGGIGSDVLKATFSHVESEEIEGYACDLYYKLITVILCTK